MNGTYNVTFLGWIIAFIGLYFLSKSKTGYNVIYYSLVLVLVVLLVGQYKGIQGIMIKKIKGE